jgi:cell division protein FtsX
MICPLCKKDVPSLVRECPSCRSDLSLLVDYGSNLREGLARAETLTRAGELGQAVWAYLSVLEVDPDNPEAGRQVGQVAAAVRHFDRSNPGQRWLNRLRRSRRLRRWVEIARRPPRVNFWTALVVALLLFLAGLALGGVLGVRAGLGP